MNAHYKEYVIIKETRGYRVNVSRCCPLSSIYDVYLAFFYITKSASFLAIQDYMLMRLGLHILISASYRSGRF